MPHRRLQGSSASASTRWPAAASGRWSPARWRRGSSGYLQRLAVHPDRQRAGLGRALTLDGLRWMRRHGGAQAAVNTQVGNEPALALYQRLGFRLKPGGLAVLRRDISP